ncbi:MAG TPA: sigma-70 family RNA polymerase sigma factor [Terracidiphilus sp.]|nr:sigma-70 family RNA polymerase sigma factor [Terracidiphilus sp.]
MLPLILRDRLTPAYGSAVEHELIAKSKRGDHAAFAELVRRNSPVALRAIRRMMYNQADAEDVLQETLLKAFAKLASFDERSTFSTWLTRIAINNALMLLRRMRYQREVSLNTEPGEGNDYIAHPALTSGTDPEKTYMRTRSVTIVRDAIGRLPGPLKQHAEWRCLEEKPHKEIASSLGITLASSKSRAQRVKRRLFRILKTTEGGRATGRAGAR